MADGIIGVNPSGKTVIEYNGVRFYTKDASVIKMASSGNVAGAARRWAGKTSTAKQMRQANKASTKPIYKNPTKSLYEKIFKGRKEDRIGATKQERLAFAKKYKETTEEVARYVEDAVLDKMDMLDGLDRIPADLRSQIKNMVRTEVEKAYAEKGEVDDSDIERISAEATIIMDDYLINNPGLSNEYKEAIYNLTESDVTGLERY